MKGREAVAGGAEERGGLGEAMCRTWSELGGGDGWRFDVTGGEMMSAVGQCVVALFTSFVVAPRRQGAFVYNRLKLGISFVGISEVVEQLVVSTKRRLATARYRKRYPSCVTGQARGRQSASAMTTMMKLAVGNVEGKWYFFR